MSNNYQHNHTIRPPERPSSQASRASSRPSSANQARPAPRVTWFGSGPRAPYALTSTPAPSSSQVRLSPRHAVTRTDYDTSMPPPATVPSQVAQAPDARPTYTFGSPSVPSNSWPADDRWSLRSSPWQPSANRQPTGSVDAYTAQLSELRHSDRPRGSITVGRPLDPYISPLDTTPTPPTALDVVRTHDRERIAHLQEEHSAVRAPDQERREWPSQDEQAAIDRALHPGATQESSDTAPDPLQATFVQQTDSEFIALDQDNLPIAEESRRWGSRETLRGVCTISNNNPYVYDGDERDAAFRNAYNVFNRCRPNKRSFEAFKRRMDDCLAMKLLESNPDSKPLRKKAESVNMSEGCRQAAMVKLEKIAGEHERYKKIEADKKLALVEEDNRQKKIATAMKRKACRTTGSKRSAREALESEIEDSSGSESGSDADNTPVPGGRKTRAASRAKPGSSSHQTPSTPRPRGRPHGFARAHNGRFSLATPTSSDTSAHSSPRQRRRRSSKKSPQTGARPRPTKKRRTTAGQSDDRMTGILEKAVSSASEDRQRFESVFVKSGEKQQETVDKLVGSLNQLSTALLNGALGESQQATASTSTHAHDRDRRPALSRDGSARGDDVEMRVPSPYRPIPTPSSSVPSPRPAVHTRDSADQFFAPSRPPSTSHTQASDVGATSPPNLRPSSSQARPSADVHLDELAARRNSAMAPSPALGEPSSSRSIMLSLDDRDMSTSPSPSCSSSVSPSSPPASASQAPDPEQEEEDIREDIQEQIVQLILAGYERLMRRTLHSYCSPEPDV
ncbi:unnamed protein product [Peniophora sp. CBMAI 1063]|nr:unnamed protein product [Peniophora sp. CBMAI 1063]